jgi:glycerol-3-phosphate O-acyltransferase
MRRKMEALLDIRSEEGNNALKDRKDHSYVDLIEGEKSPYYASTIEGKYGFFLRNLFRILFSRIELSPLEVNKVRELSQRGIIIYALRSRSDLESLLYHFQYQKNGLPVPVFACDSNMTIFHSIQFFLKTIIKKVSFFFKHRRWMSPYTTGYIEHLIRSEKSIIIYLRDIETLRKRFIGRGRDPIARVIRVQNEIKKPIYLIPQMVIWGKDPDRSKRNLGEIILGERSNPGGTRVFINFLRFYRRAFITQAQPLDLQKYIAENKGLDEESLSFQIRQLLLDRIYRERRLITGPVAKSRQEIMEEVLYDKRVQGAIERRIKKSGRSAKEVKKEAYKLLDEIVSDYNICFVRIWDRIVRWALGHVFDGIEIDLAGLERVREEARRSTLIIVPCHRSHMDYMIVSYIFYNHNIFPPHIAAGLNLAFWPFGILFRKSGAFFIRRSFKGSVLYPIIFSQYIHVLLKEGYPIEFFIEGGRSRSGKMVLPKLGFLSILINAYRSGCCEDLSFIPVAINYDRVMEERAYLREIEGNEKPKESLKGVLRSLSVIKKRFGKIYINFDEPISLNAYLKALEKRSGGDSPISKQQLPFHLAYQIVYRINRSMVVLPVSLTAASILAVSRKGFSLSQLREVASIFIDYLRYEGVKLTGSISRKDRIDYALKETLDIFLREKIIIPLKMDERDEKAEEDDPLFELSEKHRPNLEYYKNNIIHFLLPMCFVSVSILYRGKNTIHLQNIHEDFAFMRELFFYEFVFPPDEGNGRFIERAIQYMKDRNFIRENHGGYMIHGRYKDDLLYFASLIQSSFESYYIVGSSLKFLYKRLLPEWRFMRRVRSTGQKLLQIGKVKRPESLSHVSYRNAIQFMIDQKIIITHRDRGLIEGNYFTLTQERKKIYWKKAKDFLSIYS